MDKFIAITVPDERAAANLISALEQLDLDGAIELFATAVATREPDGRVVVKSRDDRTGLATVGMTSLGALDAAKAVGGRVLRQPIGDAVKAEMRAEQDAAREEMEQLDAAIAQASGEAKAHLEKQREAAEAAHARRSEERKTRMQELEKAWDAKLKAVEEKIHRSTEAARARHEEHAKKFARFVEQQKKSYRELFA